jgi:hypothetical protein
MPTDEIMIKDIGKYFGETNENKTPQGKGKLEYLNGDTFEGDFESLPNNNFKEVKGTLTYKNGDKFEGDYFLNGKPDYKGKFTYNNGDFYEGSVSNGKPNGEGNLTFSSGSKFEGKFKNGIPIEKGKLTITNGNVFQGHIDRNGVPNGEGTMYYSSTGNKFIGTFKDAEYYGKGKLIYANGDEYEGYFKDTYPNGIGKMKYMNGDEYEGEFRNGQPLKKEILHSANVESVVKPSASKSSKEEGIIFFEKTDTDNREKYDGELLNEKPHGKGELTYKNGTIVTGIFENGILKEVLYEKKPEKSNLFRNLAIGTAGVGIAGLSYYMWKRSKSRRKSISPSESNRSSKRRWSKLRRSKRRHKNKMSL